MKRAVFLLLAIFLTIVSFLHLRLTTAQSPPAEANGGLPIMDASLHQQLIEVQTKLDTSDSITGRFAELASTQEGQLALAGILDELVQQSREQARSQAVERFVDAHFETSTAGKLVPKSALRDDVKHWQEKSQTLAENFKRLTKTTNELAGQLDRDQEAAGLLKRLLSDPQAPAAILLFEMEGGGDVVQRFIEEAMQELLVAKPDGSLQIVPSRREEASQQLKRFQLAEDVRAKLIKLFPAWGGDLDTFDQPHQKLKDYLSKPSMAAVVSLHVTEEGAANASGVVEELFTQLERASIETADGMRIVEPEAWEHLDEIFAAVDRAEGMSDTIASRLQTLATSLTNDDELTKQFAGLLRGRCLAAMIAAEIPYAENDPGEELKAMLSEVLIKDESGKLQVNPDHVDEVADKARELIRTCRAIRRHVLSVDELLAKVDDHAMVSKLGDAGRYLLLSEIRRFAESYRPDPVELLHQELLVASPEGKLRVREDRSEWVRELAEMVENIRAEAASDDF